MIVNRNGLEFTLTKSELYAAHREWERDVVYAGIYARVKDMYDDWDCSLGGLSLDEVVEEGVAAFLERIEDGRIFGRVYDDVVADLVETYGNENTIS